jgi:uncharacterized heparinase superfamily protein
MSAPEIWHRIVEQIKRKISKFHKPNFANKSKYSYQLPKFPNNSFDLRNIQNNKQLLEEWNKLAKKVQTNKFNILGVEWPDNFEKSIWHLDPVTKKQWPSKSYCFQINFKNTNEYGDVKYVWELNRLQHLQPLAALAVINKNETLATYCLKEIESWIDNNPPFDGINWSSGIELACRVVSILIVTTLVDDNLVSIQQKNKIADSLAYHGYWLMRYPSRFSSANNHLIAEAGALYLLGKLAPNLPQAKKWSIYGKKTLIQESTKQIYKDGVGGEQSPTYTAFTLEWLLLCGQVGFKLNDEFPTNYWERIEKAGQFIRWLTDKNGNQPRIGDDDEGHVFYSHQDENFYATSILACIAKLTQRKDLLPPINTSNLREIFFGSSSHKKSKIIGVRHFKEGGYTVSRSIVSDKEIILVIDHGPLGYLSIAAHGHADALAIWLHIDGQPIIVDSGTYLYHAGGNWREYMRSTHAHNTLTIGSTSSSKTASAFNWSTKAKTSLLTFSENQNQWALEAEHDGYLKNYGLKHRRRVEKLDNTCLIIKDSLHGPEKELPIEIGFLLHPDLEVKKQNSCWHISKNKIPLLQIELAACSLRQYIQYGETDPIRGWYSENFGKKVKTSRLVFQETTNTNTTFCTTLKLIL